MKILITGGAGFIGSNLVRYWLHHHPEDEVIAVDRLAYGNTPLNLEDLLDNPRLTFVRGDLSDALFVRRLFERHEIENVIHAAAQSHVDRAIVNPERTLQDNILSTFLLLETMRLHCGDRGRFHQVSTDEVFGQLPSEGKFHESSPYAPNNPYSATKAAADHLVRAYHHTYGLRTTITYGSNNFGPYQFPDKFIPRMICRALKGETLPLYGDGSNVRDWLYVEDHCRALDRVFHEGLSGTTYCVGGNNERTNLELLRTLCRLVDEKLGRPEGTSERQIVFVKDRPGHDFRYALDSSKIRLELGWKPHLTFEDALLQTVEWYLTHPRWIEQVGSP